MPEERPWYHLSLPGTTSWPAFRPPAAPDPLQVWPDAWEPLLDCRPWAVALDWPAAPGERGSLRVAEKIKADIGFNVHTLNYAFNYVFDCIPTRFDEANKVPIFDLRREERYRELDFVEKQKNFYAGLKYIQHYPTKKGMKDVLGMSNQSFYRKVSPMIYKASTKFDFMEWQLRLWDYNRTEHFVERVLQLYDGFPISVCASSNKWVRRLSKSGKYQVRRIGYGERQTHTAQRDGRCSALRCSGTRML